MSLDFAVLAENGSPDRTVHLGVDAHHELMTVAADYGFGVLQKFKDYYEDAEVAAIELPKLASEVEKLRILSSSIDVQVFLDSLRDLIDYAISNGKEIHAIAD